MDNDLLSRTKVFMHPDRFAEWFNTGTTLPITAQLDPTNRCNYDCSQCAGLRIDRNAELSLEQMTRIIDQLAPFIRGIEFTGGGEPLMNKQTPEAMVYANDKKISVALDTNGHLLTPRIIDQILLSNPVYIRISLDAINSAMHRLNKGTQSNESFEMVKKNIASLVAAKNQLTSGCTIGVAYLTDYSDDANTISDFITTAKNLGVDYAQFRPYHHSNANFIHTIEEFDPLLYTGNFKTPFSWDKFKILFSRDKYEKIRGTYTIPHADEFRIVVSATGDIYPDCFTRGIKNFSYGNLLTDDFKDIWRSYRRKQITESKLQQPNCPKQCYYDALSQALEDINVQKNNDKHNNFV